MLELSSLLIPVLQEGRHAAIATVTRVARSAPRGPGASLGVTDDDRILGSISGGCVESDAGMMAMQSLRDGRARTARFGFSDADAESAGLACGGTIDVITYRVGPEHLSLLPTVDTHSAAVGIVTAGAELGRLLDHDTLVDAAAEPGSGELHRILALRESGLVEIDGAEVLVVSRARRPRLILLGASEHAAALCRIATAAGYSVTVCHPWPELVTRERFPDAVELVVDLPHEYLDRVGALDARSSVCVFTHNEHLDVPALARALELPIGFVGALGSRSTVARRAELLRERGVADTDIARIHSPLGLDLGGATPEEAAVSALAEMQLARRGGSARPLREGTGPIHERGTAPATAPSESPASRGSACTLPPLARR